MTKPRTIVIPASLQTKAQGLTKGLAGTAGDGMFTTGLSATGNAPATHYISSGPISDQMAALLPCTSVTQVDGKDVTTTDPGTPDAVPAMAAQVGINTTATKIKALYASIDVSDQEPFAAMARLGLQIARMPLP